MQLNDPNLLLQHQDDLTLLMTCKVAPALAAGCTIIVNSATQTPLSALVAELEIPRNG